MKKIHVFLTTILAFLLLTAGGSIMVKAEEAAASSAIQPGKGLVVEEARRATPTRKALCALSRQGAILSVWRRIPR